MAPLIKGKSKKAFKKNVEEEIESGKPRDEALAIAYNVKKQQKKKMAIGGEVDALPNEGPLSIADAIRHKEMYDKMRRGEEVAVVDYSDITDEPAEESHGVPEQEDADESMVSRIRRSMKRK